MNKVWVVIYTDITTSESAVLMVCSTRERAIEKADKFRQERDLDWNEWVKVEDYEIDGGEFYGGFDVSKDDG